jgi:endo-1,4-beta-xylanase
MLKPFRLAQNRIAGTELYYNDYNNEQPTGEKTAGCVHLSKKLNNGRR